MLSSIYLYQILFKSFYMKLVTKYQISAINSCWEKCAYMFNVYKNQLSRQTGSRNLNLIFGHKLHISTPYRGKCFLDLSDSYFLFADLVGFYTHWTYMRFMKFFVFVYNTGWYKTFNISWIKPYSWKFMDLVFHVPKWHKNDKDSQMDI
jgi:hypothetical protein